MGGCEAALRRELEASTGGGGGGLCWAWWMRLRPQERSWRAGSVSCVPLPTPTCCRPPAAPRLPLVAFEVRCAWALGGFPSVFAGIFGRVGQKALKSVFHSHWCQEASPALPCVGPALCRAPRDHRLGVPRHPHSASPGPRLGMGGTCRGGRLSPSHTLGHPASLGAAKFPLGLGGQLGTPPRGLQNGRAQHQVGTSAWCRVWAPWPC